MLPVFSIITVCYNAENFIERTIQSVLFQSYKQIEYLIIDGNSKDKTLEIITPYKKDIACLISEPDKGIYDAMNKGLQRATGDYVWFINAGDTLYEKTTVEKIVASLNKEEMPEIIYGENVLTNNNGNIIASRRLKAPETLTWKSFRWGMLVCHQSFIAQRMIAPFFNTHYRFSADVDWCIQCMKKANQLHNTHLILSCYLEEGTTTANRNASLKERFHILCHYYGTFPTALRHVWFAIRYHWAKLTHVHC